MRELPRGGGAKRKNDDQRANSAIEQINLFGDRKQGEIITQQSCAEFTIPNVLIVIVFVDDLPHPRHLITFDSIFVCCLIEVKLVANV